MGALLIFGEVAIAEFSGGRLTGDDQLEALPVCRRRTMSLSLHRLCFGAWSWRVIHRVVLVRGVEGNPLPPALRREVDVMSVCDVAL